MFFIFVTPFSHFRSGYEYIRFICWCDHISNAGEVCTRIVGNLEVVLWFKGFRLARSRVCLIHHSLSLLFRVHCVIFRNAEDDEDHESVHEGMEQLAGSSATKRTRARQILKSPAKRVSCDLLYTFNWQNNL